MQIFQHIPLVPTVFSTRAGRTPVYWTALREVHCVRNNSASFVLSKLYNIERNQFSQRPPGLNEKNQRPAQRPLKWHREGLLDHSAIGSKLPVVENSLTQVSPGPSIFDATIASDGEVTVGRALIKPPSIGVMVLRPESIGFYVPTRWVGDLRFNGVIATPSAIHMPVDDIYFHIRGREREVLGCILPRRRFVETVAALRGVAPDSMVLHERALELAPNSSVHLRKGLAAALEQYSHADIGSTSRQTPFDLSNRVFELIVDAYLHARPEPKPKCGRVRDPGRIVRAAEERFAQAEGEAISLADLCAAAGVSKSALYLAFQQWCGEPPLAYFHKRRLTKARTHLLIAQSGKGGVTSAAQSQGITELGRFSRDYKRLFGESPRITLGRPYAV